MRVLPRILWFRLFIPKIALIEVLA